MLNSAKPSEDGEEEESVKAECSECSGHSLTESGQLGHICGTWGQTSVDCFDAHGIPTIEFLPGTYPSSFNFERLSMELGPRSKRSSMTSRLG